MLEVNVPPSLLGSSPLDLAIKGQLMTDVFHVVGIYPCDERLLERFTLHPDSSSGNGSGVLKFADGILPALVRSVKDNNYSTNKLYIVLQSHADELEPFLLILNHIVLIRWNNFTRRK